MSILIPMERFVRAPVEKVWRMWTTAAGPEKWWGPEGFVSKCTKLDVRKDGGFEIEMTAVQADIVAYLESNGIPVTSKDGGTYSDVQLHRRLAWSKGVDFIPGVAEYTSDTVVEITALDDGRVRILVVLTPMHDEHWTRMKKLGWEQQLEKLVRIFDS